jgi:UDP-glucuronate decarboxylase
MNNLKKKTVVVTGGAGFVGIHLCHFLIGKGRKVICLDNLSTGNKVNILDLLKNKNFKFIEVDVTEFPPSVIGKVAIGEIYH